MSLFNTHIITVTRKTPGNYTDSPDGSYTEGTSSTFTITGSWQPASGEDQKALPEGKRSSSVYKIYTSTELRVIDQISQEVGDTILSPLDGHTYEVNSAGAYRNILIPHYRYLLVRSKEVEE